MRQDGPSRKQQVRRLQGGLLRLGTVIPLMQLGAATLGYVAIAHGQSREALMLRARTTVAETIQLIEREGETYPASPTAHPLPSYYVENPPQQGGRDRKCVEVVDQVDSWSGDFIIGGSVPNVDRDGQMKFWWMPLEQIPGMSLQVRAMRLDLLGQTLRFRVDRTATPVPSKGDDLFFPWWLEFPEAGRWVVVGTSNRNWGCFVISVSGPERGAA